MKENTIFSKPETIRFKHVDFAGIVFYPRFLEMLNDLVEDWFAEELDRPFSKIHATNGIPTVDLKVQFRKAARIGDKLTKSLWVSKLGSSSVTIGFRFDHTDGSICLEGDATLVNVGLDENRTNLKSMPFSKDIKGKMLKYQMPNSNA